VLHLMELCEEDPDHAMAVAAIARSLFASLAAPLDLPPESLELLEAAALLANVGLFISHSRHHLHSYYVIRNAECLTGFTDNEVEMIAQIARYHRRSAPSVERHPEFAALAPERQRVVRSLAAILRVAIGLDRSHAGNVAGVEVALGDTVEIRVRPTDGAEADLEIWSAQQRSGLLAEVVGRPVRVGPA
jgi:exopolyphosphatase/guanosine-5'-triphosphate,3'-diphosphate pyrophosphatase